MTEMTYFEALEIGKQAWLEVFGSAPEYFSITLGTNPTKEKLKTDLVRSFSDLKAGKLGSAPELPPDSPRIRSIRQRLTAQLSAETIQELCP